MTTVSLVVEEASQISSARRAVTRAAEAIGFDETRSGRAALVVTELGTNLLKHAKQGEILVTACHDGERRGIEILSVDNGRGLGSAASVLEDGVSTAGTLGHGLGAVRRQSDTFDLFSLPGKGAAILSRIWQVSRGAVVDVDDFVVSGVSVPKAGEECCGDQWSFEHVPHRAALIVADGLGHGILAAEAASAAIVAFKAAPLRAPAMVLEDVHAALRPTRGAAVAIATLDFERELALVAGLGNIAGAIVTGGTRRNLVSHNGTAGHTARRLQEFSYPMTIESTIVMHSDGLTAHWNPADYPGLWDKDPALVAGVLYRDCTRRRDDATVVVAARRPA